MDQIIIIENLTYTCIIPTTRNNMFAKKADRENVKNIIESYFNYSNLKFRMIQFINAKINENYVKITFKAPSSADLPKFIRNFKSITSRNIKNLNVWQKNYLLVSENNL